MAADSVLDIDCGTGAMLCLARERGHRGRLVGLDPDRNALDRARGKADAEWIDGTAADANSGADFDLATMTGYAFQFLVTDQEARFAHRHPRDIASRRPFRVRDAPSPVASLGRVESVQPGRCGGSRRRCRPVAYGLLGEARCFGLHCAEEGQGGVDAVDFAGPVLFLGALAAQEEVLSKLVAAAFCMDPETTSICLADMLTRTARRPCPRSGTESDLTEPR
ncbi:class I SAM-dependent methyltransferase [Streptomyces sp. NPDC058409]|uniref:class I SAM-dependent methyltransferase n=1 Tax=Streptomyces sp. NPDC058409 TaxID=3346484 RepID=UPI0036585168